VIPKRRTRPRMMAPKEDAPIKCPGHMKWVRGHECLAAGKLGVGPLGTGIGYHECEGRIEAHHVTSRGAGGGDEQVVPLCSLAHKNVHDGCCFEMNMRATAIALWNASPHGKQYRMQEQTRLSASLPSPTPTPEE
jgi:hypothetical protein